MGFRFDAESGQPIGDAANIEFHDRAEIGIDHGRGQPFVLAEFRGHLMRGADKDIGKFLGDDPARFHLVPCIEKTVHRKQIATPSKSASRNARTAARNAAPSSGISMLPSWRSRSGTSRRNFRSTSAGGLSA